VVSSTSATKKHDGKKQYHPAPLPITIADGQRG
jgi:hypothetical protein